VAEQRTVEFLVAASRYVPADGWMFTGFNWPMLAVRTARRLGGSPTELFESGQAVAAASDLIPSSTTDYFALSHSTTWVGTTLDALALIARCRIVMLDASVVDDSGRINSFGAGSSVRPSFRSAGGGGSADAAARASQLVLVHGGDDIARFARPLEHITAAPSPGARVALVTRWGTAQLGANPTVIDVADGPDADDFVRAVLHGTANASGLPIRPPATARESEAATAVLVEAGSRGYRAGLPFLPLEHEATSGGSHE
jgi:hypothetical protein